MIPLSWMQGFCCVSSLWCVCSDSGRLRVGRHRGGEGGEGPGRGGQLLHPLLEENSQGVWIQDHLEPLSRWGTHTHTRTHTHTHTQTQAKSEWKANRMSEIKISHACCSSSLPVGGDEKHQLVSSSSTTFTIPNLQESSAYKILVSSMVGGREGSPAVVTARTCEETSHQSIFIYRAHLHQQTWLNKVLYGRYNYIDINRN